MATPALPDGVSPRIHDIITGEGFTYAVDYRHDLADIHDDDSERIQIRYETETSKLQVRRLQEATKAGAKIDLMAITKDGYRIFGNHRFAAYKALGTLVVPVIVVDVNAAEADEEVLRRLRIVGYRENAQHGLPNSRRTVEMAVVDFRREEWDNARIARELGVAPGRIAEIVATDKGQQALDEQGIVTKLPKAVIAALGRASDDLNREPFKQLVKLTADANLSKTDVNALAKSAKDAGSDDDAVALIAIERQRHRARIDGTDSPKPSFAAQLRQKLGFVVGKASNPQVLVEHSSASAAEHLAMVTQSIAVLETVRDLMLAAQEEAA